MATKTYRVDITVDWPDGLSASESRIGEDIVMGDYNKALTEAGFDTFTTVDIFNDDELD